MPRRRTRINWLYDNELQQFTTPTGRVVTLHEIAQLLTDHVNCRFDFAGPWSGWRMRGAVLIPPGGTYRGSNITASNALGYRRWLASFEGQQAQLDFDEVARERSIYEARPRKGPPKLRLVVNKT